MAAKIYCQEAFLEESKHTKPKGLHLQTTSSHGGFILCCSHCVVAMGRALLAALAAGNISSTHARLFARLLADIFSKKRVFSVANNERQHQTALMSLLQPRSTIRSNSSCWTVLAR